MKPRSFFPLVFLLCPLLACQNTPTDSTEDTDTIAIHFLNLPPERVIYQCPTGGEGLNGYHDLTYVDTNQTTVRLVFETDTTLYLPAYVEVFTLAYGGQFLTAFPDPATGLLIDYREGNTPYFFPQAAAKPRNSEVSFFQRRYGSDFSPLQRLREQECSDATPVSPDFAEVQAAFAEERREVVNLLTEDRTPYFNYLDSLLGAKEISDYEARTLQTTYDAQLALVQSDGEARMETFSKTQEAAATLPILYDLAIAIGQDFLDRKGIENDPLPEDFAELRTELEANKRLKPWHRQMVMDEMLSSYSM